MSSTRYQFLRWLFIVLATAHLVGVAMAYTIYSHVFDGAHINPVTTPFSWWHNLAMTIVLSGLGITLAGLLKKPSYHLFLAAFLIFLGANYALPQGWWWTGLDWMPTIHTPLTGALFIYSMMRFSGKHSTTKYNEYFKQHKRPNWYRHLVIYLSNDKAFWLAFVPLLAGVLLLCSFISNAIGFAVNILILVAGLIYFRISYFFAGKQNQNRLAWLLWGLISTIVLYLISLFLWQLYPELKLLRIGVSILTSVVTCLAFIFSIFFSHSTDAHIVVRKTLLYSSLFLAGLFLFGVVEHLVIHTIAHALHIESSILSSCLGAAIVLAIRPLHHSVEHRLNKWENSKKLKLQSTPVMIHTESSAANAQ